MAWLEQELKRHHVDGVKEVFLLSVDEQGQVYFAKREGKG